MERRGQAAAGAAVLLAIIAGFIVMFIILIPPADREELLGDSKTTTTSKTVDTAVTQKNVLLVTPGRVDFLAQKEIEHPLPVVNIYTKTESKILAQKNMGYAKKGVFTEEVSEFHFSLPDVDYIDDVLLSFFVESTKGRLIILVNGQEFFEGDVQKGNVAPLTLPKGLLAEENVITFAISSPGLAFWRTHEAVLQNIKLVGDIMDVAAQSSKHVFLVSDTEKANLEKVMLKFQPGCTYGVVGKLTVTLNGNEVYSGIPDCDIALVPIEVSPSLLYEGENTITFYAEKGTYILSHVNVVSQLKEVDFPTYYFELSKEDFDALQNKDRKLRLKIEFVDVITAKTGTFVFNGHSYNFDTKAVTEVIDVGDSAVMGTNALKVKPKKTLEIRELRVDLVK